MLLEKIIEKALNFSQLSLEEGLKLFSEAPTSVLMDTAHKMRNKLHPNKIVTWIIDRNANTTNVCVANCKFCNFYRIPGHPESYITTIEEYTKKIEETFFYGGEQLLLQGGHHPDLGIEYYSDLFRELKKSFPNLKLHALGPPEIIHLCEVGNLQISEVLKKLVDAGLDSLPGAGAEILVDRVRRLIANGKCSAKEWLEVMREAHKINLPTSATMMFGHIETLEERIEHMIRVREVQNEKPKEAHGFLNFVLWPFQDEETLLKRVKNVTNTVSQNEYLKMLALSRIMLPNINNIQASWLTVGKKTAQLALCGGANDFGSIMIEENVVSAAGAPHRFSTQSIQDAIQEAGFTPQLRNQKFEHRELPEGVETKVVRY